VQSIKNRERRNEKGLEIYVEQGRAIMSAHKSKKMVRRGHILGGRNTNLKKEKRISRKGPVTVGLNHAVQMDECLLSAQKG